MASFLKLLYLFQVVTERLVILYILYAYYAAVSVTENPFLTFFLEFVPGMQLGTRGNWIEQYFVCAILEDDMDKVKVPLHLHLILVLSSSFR